LFPRGGKLCNGANREKRRALRAIGMRDGNILSFGGRGKKGAVNGGALRGKKEGRFQLVLEYKAGRRTRKKGKAVETPRKE